MVSRVFAHLSQKTKRVYITEYIHHQIMDDAKPSAYKTDRKTASFDHITCTGNVYIKFSQIEGPPDIRTAHNIGNDLAQ